MNFKFSIRDLFFVVVIAALLVGWILDRNKLSNDKEALKAELDKQTVEMDLMQDQLYKLKRTRSVP